MAAIAEGLFPIFVVKTKGFGFEKVDAEDLKQDALLSILTVGRDFYSEKAFKGYLSTAFTRKLLDLSRRRQRFNDNHDEILDQLKDVLQDVQRKSDAQKTIREAISHLCGKCRDLLFEYCDGYTQTELAKKRGVSRQWINRELIRCTNKLIDFLGRS